jgi:hypothetical protein
MAVFAPIAKAMVRIVVAANPRESDICRNAYARSRKTVLTIVPIHSEAGHSAQSIES